ncbi:MAG: phosphonate dehydrogenase [Candidatus Thiodiazotropha sp.]
MKPKVVLTHWVHPEIITFLSQTCEVIANESRLTLPREEILNRACDAQALMAFMPDCIDDDFLDQCPDMEVVGGAMKGYDNLDPEACEKREIWLTNVPDLLTIPTAELTLGLMIALGRNVIQSDQYLRAGHFAGWEPRFYGKGLDSSVIGIVGMGAVGQALAKRLTGFDANLIYYDRVRLEQETERQLSVSYVEFSHLLSESDFIASILPLNDQTLHFFDDHEINTMKTGAYLINTGRGSTVNEQAVVRGLASGQIRGYAADVYEFEDWARGDRPRAIPADLLNQTDKTVFTTHIGSAVEKVRFEIAMEAAVNITQALTGEIPQGAVNQVSRI